MENLICQKVSCVVNYTYEASEPDELTLRPGDILRDVERLPGGWWRGELRGRRGMFPDNFVTVLSDPATHRPGNVQGRCRAVFSYQPANPDELPLCVGDVLDVLAEVEEGWWQGRRQGRVGVFPSNFVVMLEPHAPPVPVVYDHAPALPPKPVKEQCRVLFNYTAVNDDELTLVEGDIVNIISRDAPDRGWWRGELQGRVGLFPDNFVQLLPAFLPEVEEKKPERPPSKNIILNKYSEKTASVKELTTSRTSLQKDSTSNKEAGTHKESVVTQTNKTESEKLIHSETVSDGSLENQLKKPPVPSKKSPTPSSGVGGLLSGLKNKVMSTSEKEKSTISSSTSSSSGEWDKPDGIASSKTTPGSADTFDKIERNSMLNDPRAGRVKAPRRRPPSQVLRDDSPHQIGLSNGQHEGDKPLSDKAEEIKPKTREWEKHKAPWMEELKLNQAKKTTFVSEVGKSRSMSSSSETGVASKAGSGSTDRILECGLDEKKSTHAMEMSKSTSSISSRISLIENFEETKIRHSLDSKKDAAPAPPKENEPVVVKTSTVHSPTAAGRTFTTMLDEIKKQPAPAPPITAIRTTSETATEKTNNTEKISSIERLMEFSGAVKNERKIIGTGLHEKPINLIDKPIVDKSTVDKVIIIKPNTDKVNSSTLERNFTNYLKSDKNEQGTDALIAQLSNRILNLETLLEVKDAKFTAAIEDLNAKLVVETEKRLALQAEMEKLAQCVTQV